MEQPPARKEQPSTFDWKTHGIENEDQITLADVGRIFEQHPELIEEMKKRFSMNLKQALENDASRHQPPMPFVIDPWHIMSFDRFNGKNADRNRIVGPEANGRSIAIASLMPFKGNRLQHLAFPYSTDEQTALASGDWIRPDKVSSHGIYFAEAGREGKLLPLTEAERDPYISAQLDPNILARAIRSLTKEQADCSAALADVERLGVELGIDQKRLQTLQSAIQDFATYVKPEPKTPHEQFCEVGRCFTVPGMFRDYCRIMHDLNIGTDEYDKTHRGHSLFYHQINILEEKLIVDWTARQYRAFDREHYPFVYPLGDKRISSSWGPLMHAQREEFERIRKEESLDDSRG